MMGFFMKFLIRSSSGSGEYEVSLAETARGLALGCTCPAGEKGQACKHRIDLLDGDDSSVIGGTGSVEALQNALSGGPIEAALAQVYMLEGAVEAAQSELRKAKKALARAMAG